MYKLSTKIWLAACVIGLIGMTACSEELQVQEVSPESTELLSSIELEALAQHPSVEAFPSFTSAQLEQLSQAVSDQRRELQLNDASRSVSAWSCVHTDEPAFKQMLSTRNNAFIGFADRGERGRVVLERFTNLGPIPQDSISSVQISADGITPFTVQSVDSSVHIFKYERLVGTKWEDQGRYFLDTLSYPTFNTDGSLGFSLFHVNAASLNDPRLVNRIPLQLDFLIKDNGCQSIFGTDYFTMGGIYYGIRGNIMYLESNRVNRRSFFQEY